MQKKKRNRSEGFIRRKVEYKRRYFMYIQHFLQKDSTEKRLYIIIEYPIIVEKQDWVGQLV